jgi:thiamine-phosphate diphosphorylase
MIYLKAEREPQNNHMLKGYRFLISALIVASVVTPCFAFASPRLWKNGYGKNRNPLIYEKMSNRLKASQQVSTPNTCFAPHNPPFLAVITEPGACDTEERMAETVQAMSSAVSTGKVALVSVRVVAPKHDESAIDFQQRVVSLTTQLVELSSQYSFRVVVTSDWVDAAIQAGAHGIHVKERDRERIPEIRKEFATPPLIGTSAHTISSALEATSLYQPDYMFVGTCYPTQSHPEKTKLEGPALSGQICRALEKVETSQQKRPVVFAIGGINEENCAEPVLTYGADGVAAIRSVLQSPNPAKSVETMASNMSKCE